MSLFGTSALLSAIEECVEEEDIEISESFNDSSFSSLPTHVTESNMNSSTKEESNDTTFNQRTERTTLLSAFLVLVAWTCAVGIFLYVGITSEINETNSKFEGQAEELVSDISSVIVDYERYARWIHQRCTRAGKNLSHQDFKNLYTYIVSQETRTSMVAWLPNITHEERRAQEAFSRNYYQNRTGYYYYGFASLRQDVQAILAHRLNNGESTTVSTPSEQIPPSAAAAGVSPTTTATTTGAPQTTTTSVAGSNQSQAITIGPVPPAVKFPSDDHPYYFPAHYVEPLFQNLVFYDVDFLRLHPVSEHRVFGHFINKSIETGRPVLTTPTDGIPDHPVRERRHSYGFLVHPGVFGSGSNMRPSAGVSMIEFSIPTLLHQAARKHVGANLKLYLYDQLGDDEIEIFGQETFLGGLSLEDDNNATFFDDDVNTTYPREAILESNPTRYAPDILVGGRTWKVIIVPVGNVYQADLTFILVGAGFIFLGSFFLGVWLYHNYRRSKKVEELRAKAKAGSSIVASLFPAGIHDRLLEDEVERQKAEKARKRFRNLDTFINPQESGSHKPVVIETQDRVTSFRSSVESSGRTAEDPSVAIFGSKPIADLFPDATIMFADLVGFTAWSSVREPTQVFILLETIYHAFDMLAKKRRVFKVETVGDCYVAVSGLPQPRKDHAVVMAKFASACLHEMQQLARSLETSLGPDTGDLNLRIGLHSGEVTAGVLRGDKGRFQLFGDTVNTASRMESTGEPGRIQVSESTADLLKAAQKGNWLLRRQELVVAKGKGALQTYWLLGSSSLARRSASSIDDQSSVTGSIMDTGSAMDDSSDEHVPLRISSGHSRSSRSLGGKDRVSTMEMEKTNRLIKWNVEVLSTLLKKLVARRMAKTNLGNHTVCQLQISSQRATTTASTAIPLDEVQDIIMLPEFEERVEKNQIDHQSVTLGDDVKDQLHSYVSIIASLYRRNSFHNFEHASHVIMSVTKLLSRITEPSKLLAGREDDLDAGQDLHDYTFGITSDPMTLFACAFSALIHDVDHPGVPNSALVEEDAAMSDRYRQKSVAEQNSIEIGWELLMEDQYKALRECICTNQQEFAHFRQLVVNVVMATDVMDKDLGAQRKARWEKAFSSSDNINDGFDGDSSSMSLATLNENKVNKNRKATIVIEHIIQASDVAHTMQHWHIYAKWNERLFHEMYRAYQSGRLTKDPSIAWYEGEKGFFDYYILPLAKKLDVCGVFGASSSEYYNYAVRNREEWEVKGKEMVESYLERISPVSPSSLMRVEQPLRSSGTKKSPPPLPMITETATTKDLEMFEDEMSTSEDSLSSDSSLSRSSVVMNEKSESSVSV